MSDRSWQHGLQQMIECKESCPLTGQRETIARISYQRFFKRYLHLGGMSGTLFQVRNELRSIYGQSVISIPNNQPSLRKHLGCRVYKSSHDKQLALINTIVTIHKTGQPILVGTGSVYDSESLAQLLIARKLPVCVLNAGQDSEEAKIVAMAGQRGQITIATNMAGRGTDIKLGPGVTGLGGLHVIAASRNEEYRIDRQLFGRCARQGDPGSYESLTSLDDDLIYNFYPTWVRRFLGWNIGRANFDQANSHLTTDQTQPLSEWLSRFIIWMPQKVIARHYRILRRDLIQLHEKLGEILAFSGPRE